MSKTSSQGLIRFVTRDETLVGLLKARVQAKKRAISEILDIGFHENFIRTLEHSLKERSKAQS